MRQFELDIHTIFLHLTDCAKKKWIYEKSFMLQIISLSVFMLISSRAGRREENVIFEKPIITIKVMFSMAWEGGVA